MPLARRFARGLDRLALVAVKLVAPPLRGGDWFVGAARRKRAKGLNVNAGPAPFRPADRESGRRGRRPRGGPADLRAPSRARRPGSDKPWRRLVRVQLPNGTDSWAASIRRAQFAMNLITWAEPCLRHDLNLATAAMFAQCIAKHFPVLSAESKGAEESGFARAVPMIRIEQIINDLLSFDQQPLATWKDQVRWSTGPRPSDALPSRRVPSRHRYTSQRISNELSATARNSRS